MCTGAAVFNFLHKRGGFANSWEFIPPAVENAPPRTSSTTDGNLTVLTEKDRQPTRNRHFVNARARFCNEGLWDTIWTSFGQLPDAPRTPPGRAADASRARLGRLPDTPRTLVGCLFGSLLASLRAWLAILDSDASRASSYVSRTLSSRLPDEAFAAYAALR